MLGLLDIRDLFFWGAPCFTFYAYNEPRLLDFSNAVGLHIASEELEKNSQDVAAQARLLEKGLGVLWKVGKLEVGYFWPHKLNYELFIVLLFFVDVVVLWLCLFVLFIWFFFWFALF